MQADNAPIEEIIVRELNGAASAAELARLHHWLEADPAHREEYEALLQLWKDATPAVLPHAFDASAGWKRFSEQLGLETSPPAGKLVSFLRYKKAVAVAAAVVVTAAALWLYPGGKPSDPLSWNHIRAEENREVVLADGSRVSLRKGSTLSYAQDHGKQHRKVTLNGEAYFEIRHDEAQPFEITTPSAVVTDLGTAFLLRAGDSLAEVIVTEGKVNLASKESPSLQTELVPGQKGTLKGKQLSRAAAREDNFLAWQTGRLVFRNAPLSQVAEDLSRSYQVPVALAPGLADQELVVTAEFHGQPLSQVLEELELLAGLRIKKEGAVFLISR